MSRKAIHKMKVKESKNGAYDKMPYITPTILRERERERGVTVDGNAVARMLGMSLRLLPKWPIALHPSITEPEIVWAKKAFQIMKYIIL